MAEPGVDKARSAKERAEKELKSSPKLSTAESALLRLEERLEGLRKQTLSRRRKRPCRRSPDKWPSAEEQLKQARKDDESIKRRHEEVEQGRKRLAERERNAMRDLQNARDRLASLDPPKLSFDDPAIDWKSLIAWAGKQATTIAEAQAEAEAEQGRRLRLGSR